MEAIKTSPNVEFDVIYADGTRHHVAEGILLGVDGEQMILHNGTNRANVLFAAAETIFGAIADLGLDKQLIKYLESTLPQIETEEVEICCETCKHEHRPGKPCETADYDCMDCDWEECICTQCHSGSKWERRGTDGNV